jgi:uncharacterized protein YjbI with pentapeptide repeats
MPDPAINEATAGTALVCGVKMHDDKPCGRPIHSAPELDHEPVCLMHSHDPEKSDEDFQAEFERILTEADRMGMDADFSGFVFRSSNCAKKIFASACRFRHAIFTLKADFTDAEFTQQVDFTRARFAQEIDFTRAAFRQTADFISTEFLSDAYFHEATFGGETNFQSATFKQSVIFYGSVFTEAADFTSVAFTWSADFIDAKFRQDTNFLYAKFNGGGIFASAEFSRDINFERATFTLGADFRGVRFGRNSDFAETIFSNDASFRQASLAGEMRFRETGFAQNLLGEADLDFSDVRMEHPESVEFYKTDLGRALFYNTDVSKVDFTLVRWRDRGRTGWLRHLGRRHWGARFYVFDEDVNLRAALALEPPGDSSDERNYSLIAETYQQLKRNYDAKGAYWTAGHWHYGEMEMKRLHSRWRSRPLRWLSYHFSLVALYKYASEYGESYVLPLVWLLGAVTIFAVLYPIAGLELSKDSGGGVVGYWNIKEFFRTHPSEHPSGWLGLILHGFMTSISVAGFQRELKYAPSYPWGRLIALLELLLTTTLGALFALAIRRQFKRS